MARIQFLEPPQVHLPLQQWLDVRVEGLPVGVFQVIFLTAFVLIALHDGKIPRVVNGLHDEPGNGLFILGVDARGLNELVFQLLDQSWVGGLGPEVDGDCVDHF